MSYALNNVTAPDRYSSDATLENLPMMSIILNVANQAVYWQLKLGLTLSSGIWESTESLAYPGSTPISSDTPGEICGIRFRAAVPAASIPAGASQAVVSIRTAP